MAITSTSATTARLRVAPEDPIANYGYALVLARVEKRKEAIAHLMKALEKKALNPYMLGELGRIYFMDGNYEKALRVLEPAVTRGPSDPDAMFFLARTHMELGQFEKASGILEVLTEKYPDFTDVYYFLGTAYGQQDNMEKAHYYLGIFYARRGKLKSAAFHLTRAQETATDPKRKAEIERLLENINQRIAHASKRSP